MCLCVLYTVREESEPLLRAPRARVPILHVPVWTSETEEWFSLHSQGFLLRNIQWKGKLIFSLTTDKHSQCVMVSLIITKYFKGPSINYVTRISWFFFTPPSSLSQVVTFLSPPPSVTSYILQFYTYKLLN